MYSIETTVPPNTLPITLDQVKAHLRIGGAFEDTELTEFIKVAVKRFEDDTSRPILETYYRQHVMRWPQRLALGRGGVNEVQGVYQNTLSSYVSVNSGWKENLHNPPACIVFTTIPPVVTEPAGFVEFSAGWGSAGSVPSDIKVALKLLVGHYYQYREAFRDSAFELRSLPQGWKTICDSYRLGLFGDWGQ